MYRLPERLIVNADDYGYSAPVNNAILDLLQRACISSTTILANMATEEDLQAIKRFPGKAGIHLNYIEGKPLNPAYRVRTITDDEGNFLGSKTLFAKVLLGKVRIKELEIETQAQLDRLYQHGIRPSHADSHQHAHVFPFISETVLKILARNKIHKVRYPFPSDSSTLRMRTLRYFCMLAKRNLKQFSTPELLYTEFSVSQEPDYSRVLNCLQQVSGTSEWMCHPSKENDLSYLNKKAEYLFLKSDAWHHVRNACNISMIDYSEL